MKQMKCSIETFREIADELQGQQAVLSLNAYLSGQSMHPTILEGELVHITSFDVSESKLGDILIFKRGSDYFAHRLIKKLNNTENGVMLVTAGDAYKYPDPPIHIDSVIGKAISIERNGRIISLETPMHRLVGKLRAFVARYRTIRVLARKAGRIKRAISKH
jgi:signal peptidase I